MTRRSWGSITPHSDVIGQHVTPVQDSFPPAARPLKPAYTPLSTMSRRIATSWSKQLPQGLHCRAGALSRVQSVPIGLHPPTPRVRAPAATSYHLQTSLLTPRIPSSPRPFSTSPALHKKSGKANLSYARSDSSPPVRDAHDSTPTDDAFDLSTMESQILKAIERLTHDLAELRSGGRLNPENIEKLKVTLKTTGSAQGPKETHRVGDLAQVIPKGRVVSVVAGDEEVRQRIALLCLLAWA